MKSSIALVWNESGFKTSVNQQSMGVLHNYPPESEASREVANLTERKNPHTLVYGVKEFVKLPYFSGRAWEVKMVILQKIF